jgi:hypothetical protein
MKLVAIPPKNYLTSFNTEERKKNALLLTNFLAKREPHVMFACYIAIMGSTSKKSA